jgi:hypothetical protein
MGDNIRGTDSKSPVQHPQAECKSITRVASVILPFTPHKLCGSVSTLRVWHDSTNKNADKEACEDQETSDGFNGRKRSVGIQNDQTTSPDADDIGYTHMPSLYLIALVKKSVHRDALCSNDFSSAGQSKNPGQEVPPPRKPTTYPTVWTCCY